MLRKKGIALAISLAFPAASFALGLGAMKTSSHLSQPFSARIELLGATASELDDIAVKLADAAQFQRAGLVLNAQLLALRFEVVNDPKGDYIKVSTRGPVNEPVLDFIVELRSPTGTILREYAVLLDPPSYALRSAPPARQPVPSAPVATAAPVTAASAPVPMPAPAAAPPIARTPAPRAALSAAAEKPAAAAQRPAKVSAPRPAEPVRTPEGAAKPKAPASVARPAAPPAKPRPAAPPAPPPPPPAEPLAEGEVALKANETLWEVAKRYRPSASVSVPQMMIAIQRANPEAFPDNNVRNIRPGATLAIPDEESIASVSEAEADAEVQRQVARWRERRLAIASRPAPQAKPAVTPAQPVESKASAGAPVRSGAAAPTGDARLEIVAPGSESGTKPTTEAALKDEHAAALASEMAELRARLDEAAGIIDLLENQVKLKNEELSRLKQSGAPVAAAGTADGAGAGGAGTSATPAEPAAVTVPGTPPVPAKPPASIQDDILPAPPEATPLLPPGIVDAVPGGWLGLGGVLAALLASVGLLARRRRPKRTEPPVPEAAGTPPAASEQQPTTALGGRLQGLLGALRSALQARKKASASADQPGSLVRPVVAMPADAPVAVAAAALAPILPPEADPLEEVNIYLAYERFEQAEELVRKVISEHPDNPDYRLRLLEVLQAAGKPAEFEIAARGLRGLVEDDDPRWESARDFWREFDTGTDLLAMPAHDPAVNQDGVDEATAPPQAAVPETALESTQTGLLHTDDELGLTAETALDELDALLGARTDTAPGARDVLELDTPREAGEFATAAQERQSPRRAATPASESVASSLAAVTATELDFDLGGLDLGATGEVDLDVQSKSKAAEAALDLELFSAGESGLGATLPPATASTVLETAPEGVDLDLDLGFGAPEESATVPAGQRANEGGSATPTPTPAEVIGESDEFDLSLEGDFAASLDLAAELGLKNPAQSPVDVEAMPTVEPLPEAIMMDDLDLSLDIELESDSALAATGGSNVTHGFDLELDLVEEDLAPEALLEPDIADRALAESLPEDDLSFALDDETDTKLNLAKAYIELGETEAARSILGEVVSDGEPSQQAEARRLLSQIG